MSFRKIVGRDGVDLHAVERTDGRIRVDIDEAIAIAVAVDRR